jgi:signal transduction histidine kinase
MLYNRGVVREHELKRTGRVRMRYRLRKDFQRPFIHVSEGIVDDAGTEFQKLTGYSSNEILGMQLNELCRLLRIDTDEFLAKSEKAERSSCYLFTKDLEPREVEVWKKSEGEATALYYFREKPDSRMYENLRLFKHPFEQGKMRTALLSFPDLIMLDANQCYLKYWDETYNGNEISIGIKYTDLISEDFRNNIFDGIILKEISEGRPFFRYDVEYCHPGKRTTYWDMSYMPIYQRNEMKYIVLQCIDVTEKVLEKQKIDKQQEELEAIISSLSDELTFYNKNSKARATTAVEDAVICRRQIEESRVHVLRLSYPDLVIKKINAGYYDFLKKTRPGIVRKDIMEGRGLLTFISEDETVIFLNDMVKLLHSDKKFNSKVTKFDADGVTYYIKRFYQAFSDAEGKINEIMVFGFDITDEVREKLQAEKNLLKQEEFYANISHELKTPLNVIFSTNQLFAYYLKNGLLEENADKMLNSTNTIKQNCFRLTRLISNLTDLSKIRAGYLKLNLTRENIVSLVEDTVESIADYVKYKGLKIVFDTDTEEKIIACDPERIDRIILNLISNSVKFTKAGGNILVRVADKGDSVEIAVRDNGIGIEEENLNNIFERFYQGDSSLKCNKGGSGIGLHLAKSIVELHGGAISVESMAGEGCEFKIVIPSNL